MTYCDEILAFYSNTWGGHPTRKRLGKGPEEDLPDAFCILEFPPSTRQNLWTYATCCMSQPDDNRLLELHMFSPSQSERPVELLTIIAQYHRTGHRLGLGHTVNFGEPWIAGSHCDYGLISWPYSDHAPLPRFENVRLGKTIYCLWLIPITKQERDFKIANGLEALEQEFERSQFNYADPLRESVV